ncbi:MAG TPA: pitrilysin family protein [Bryobacteraceae bacterium]|nr:pitrilysin family protein [Bryobacteraceae bacterium]
MLKTTLAVFAAAAALGAQAIDRTKAPATPPIPDYKLPATFETKLPNGLTVVLLEDNRFPLVTVRLGFLAGAKFDPKETPGLSETTAALLTQGTGTRTARQIAEELASIGGALNGGAGPDSITISGSALAEHAPKLLEILADVTRNPAFPEEEVKLRIANRNQELQAQRSEPAFLAEEKLASVVFGSHPYSRIAPTPESLARIDRKALAGFHATWLVPNNGYLVLLGKLPPRAETLRLINERFGSWKQGQLPPAPKPEFPAPSKVIALVDRPGSVQADIHVGRLAVTRANPDYFPLMVANNILGGGASSRMFSNIREKQGFAYDAHSELDARREAGIAKAVTQVRNEVIEPATRAVLDELNGMIKGTVAPAELTRTKNFISGIYLLRLESQDGLAQQLITTKLMGLPNSFLEQYTARVRAVQPEQIQNVAGRYLNPENAAVVVVGDASKIAKPLEKFGKVEVTKAQ